MNMTIDIAAATEYYIDLSTNELTVNRAND